MNAAEPTPTPGKVEPSLGASSTPYALACSKKGHRRDLVDAEAAFLAACRAERGESEGYFSAFSFGPDIARHINENSGSTAGYRGPCSSSWMWVDLDAEADPDAAREAAAHLADHVADRYALAADDLLIFLSGAKGYHLGIPARLFGDTHPDADHPARVGALVERWFAGAQPTVEHDRSIYEHLRLFRSPNSWHPSGQVFKIRLDLDELRRLHHRGILDLAKAQRPFDPPVQPGPHPVAVADWAEAVAEVEAAAKATSKKAKTDATTGRREPPEGADIGRITPKTWDFILHGDALGSRHDELRFAAANLAEFETVDELADAVLGRGIRWSGLDPESPATRREIANGRKRTRGDI
jgi:hypothetical protein